MAKSNSDLIKRCPDRIKGLLNRPDTIFMGACIIQSKSAWTRVGPTWHVPGIGWVCGGPGVRRWGTKKGLAELASESNCSPEWHGQGWAIAQDPSLVFAMTDVALDASYMKDVKTLLENSESLTNSNS